MQKKRTRRVGAQSAAPVTKLKKKKVHCKFCHQLVPLDQAHRHDGGWVGPECWDERLRATE